MKLQKDNSIVFSKRDVENMHLFQFEFSHVNELLNLLCKSYDKA